MRKEGYTLEIASPGFAEHVGFKVLRKLVDQKYRGAQVKIVNVPRHMVHIDIYFPSVNDPLSKDAAKNFVLTVLSTIAAYEMETA